MSLKLAVDNSRSMLSAGMILAPYGAKRPRNRPFVMGLRYERLCIQAIKQRVDLETGVLAGQWFEYQRRDGERNVCQPDILAIEPDLVVVIECKNTWVENAWDQIALYNAVCECAFARRSVGFQMCKNVSPRTRGKIQHDFGSALDVALSGEIVTLHWTGKGQL